MRRQCVQALIAMAVLGAASSATLTAAAQAGPGFDCARAKAAVTRMICASPDLSALDRRLNAVFDARMAEGGGDPAALKRSQAAWLKTTRNACADEACIADAYRARIAALEKPSRKLAGADAATAPFEAPEAAFAAAKRRIGTACDGPPAQPPSGYDKIVGFGPVIYPGAVVTPAAAPNARFAFLMVFPPKDVRACKIADVVALPARGGALLQCAIADIESHGFGLRRQGQPTAYWAIDEKAGRLDRLPVETLGRGSLKCRQPETPE